MRIVTVLQGAAIAAVLALGVWVWIAPGASDCRARGGSYYVNGDCGVFVWQPR